MHDAYARGDHRTARALAQELSGGADLQAQRAAQAVLAQTQPDRIIEAFALLGLGVVAWLVYNYIL
jgi:hypothetical protein